ESGTQCLHSNERCPDASYCEFDCSGTCWEEPSASVDNDICENGNGAEADLFCSAFDFDGGDCFDASPQHEVQ
ncbi:MAG: hypothetical protein QGI45_12505, partial [Myxococcota bacterium]|nr:hypothetical protein [Myxococcota bacterium]